MPLLYRLPLTNGIFYQFHQERRKAIEKGTDLLASNVCLIEEIVARVAYSPATKELCDNFEIADKSAPPARASAVRQCWFESTTHSNAMTKCTQSSWWKENIVDRSTRYSYPKTNWACVEFQSQARSSTHQQRRIADSANVRDVEISAASTSQATMSQSGTSAHATIGITNGCECIGCCDKRRDVVLVPCARSVFCQRSYEMNDIRCCNDEIPARNQFIACTVVTSHRWRCCARFVEEIFS